MKKMQCTLVIACCIIAGISSISMKADTTQTSADWSTYNTGSVHFHDKATATTGSKIYHSIIANPEEYISSAAREVLAALYKLPSDSIPPVYDIYYTLEDVDGISAKSGGNGKVGIFYSTRWIERLFEHGDTASVKADTRGVLWHELTHAFQLEPQGIGGYGDNPVVWAFIEGMADGVRVANGGFTAADRPKGGHYTKGYRYAGFFFNWLRENKDADFLRKFNQSTLHVVPWSFNGGVKYALGNAADIDELWKEYMTAM
ncbi:MAG: basic secretory family protein, partial [Muribaculum sp.]|nr:basic secretory family protein [Muribaculum sp.]